MLASETKPASDVFAPCCQLPVLRRCLLLSYLYCCCDCTGSKANPCFQGDNFFQFVVPAPWQWQQHENSGKLRCGCRDSFKPLPPLKPSIYRAAKGEVIQQSWVKGSAQHCRSRQVSKCCPPPLLIPHTHQLWYFSNLFLKQFSSLNNFSFLEVTLCSLASWVGSVKCPANTRGSSRRARTSRRKGGPFPLLWLRNTKSALCLSCNFSLN